MMPLRLKLFARQRGMSLIELMVALVLGLLLSAGIVSVFMSASTSNRVQTGLARLQETGRFLVSRMNMDLSMGQAQYCASLEGSTAPVANGIQPTLRAMELRVPNFRFPDWGGGAAVGRSPRDAESALSAAGL
jgi:type IV pilus assembly protein PilW